jgi:hypothetical protein
MIFGGIFNVFCLNFFIIQLVWLPLDGFASPAFWDSEILLFETGVVVAFWQSTQTHVKTKIPACTLSEISLFISLTELLMKMALVSRDMCRSATQNIGHLGRWRFESCFFESLFKHRFQYFIFTSSSHAKQSSTNSRVKITHYRQRKAWIFSLTSGLASNFSSCVFKQLSHLLWLCASCWPTGHCHRF